MPTLSNHFTRARSFFSEELLLSASVLFLPVLYMTAALALLSGIGLGRWVFPTGLLLWGVAVVALHKREGWKRALVTLLLFLTVFALAAWGTSHTLDIFWDSRQYHTLALTDLLNGFNPYFHKELWYYTYPAASWLLSASLVLWTQSFETTFVFTPVAALAAFLCVRRFLFLLGLSRPWRFCLSALFVANPFTMPRVFSFYNDSILVSMLLSVFALMLCFVFDEGSQPQDKRRILRTAVLIAVLFVFLVNIKFSGIAYGGVLGLTALAYGIRRGASRRLLVQLAGLGTFAFLLGVLVFGFYPYALNTMRHQNPFHPAALLDKQANSKASVVFEKYDPAFTAMSQYEQWWNYLFGYQKRGEQGLAPEPLPPFSFAKTVPWRRSLGSFFSGSLLLCLTLVFFVRHRGAWIVTAGVFASVFVAGIGFAFRHTPQNWWLPLWILVFVLAGERGKTFLSRGPSLVAVVVALCMLVVTTRMYIPMRKGIVHALSVRKMEQVGGWHVVPDLNLSEIPYNMRRDFFNYYKSGLSGVRLPTLSECPEKAEQRKLILGLVLCRP